jgi:hypothetical protein
MATMTSPFDIAEDIFAIDLPEAPYSVIGQTRFGINDPLCATTFNQTQTFNSKGQASDKDNDKG